MPSWTTQTTQLRARLATVAPVGGGLAVVGAAAYAALALAGHSLNAVDSAAVTSMYLLTAIVGPGVFIAVEQQTNREVSGQLALGRDGAPALRSAALVSAALGGFVALVVLMASPLLVARVFGGHWPLVAATVLAVVGAAAVYLLRGLFAGQRRFGWYGASLGAEGLARLLPCCALALFGWGNADRFGFAFALGCGVAAVLMLPGLRGSGIQQLARRNPATRGDGDRAVPVRRLAGSVGLLALASGMTLSVANLGPVVLTSRVGPAGAELAFSYAALFMLARIPVFLFGPLQAFLLPALTAAAERGDVATLRRQMRIVLLAVLAVGLPGVLAAWLLGPWASRVFFDAPAELSGTVAALLGISTVAMMAAQVLQPALVALGRNRVASVAWTVASVLFIAVLFAPVNPLAAAVAAQVLAPTLVTVLMLWGLRSALVSVGSGYSHTQHSRVA